MLFPKLDQGAFFLGWDPLSPVKPLLSAHTCLSAAGGREGAACLCELQGHKFILVLPYFVLEPSQMFCQVLCFS